MHLHAMAYLCVLQVTLDIFDQLPHSFLQTPEQLLLSIKYFISHLQTENMELKVKCQYFLSFTPNVYTLKYH